MYRYKTCTVLILTCLSLLHISEGLPGPIFPVGSKQNPGKSCKDVLEHGGTVTGNYHIRLRGQTLLVYCDQTTEGGGWTLVYSYTFRNYENFWSPTNALVPRPNWPAGARIPISTTPPKSKTDYNAMDFNLWKKLGTEFILKSNINNWYTCSDGTGSLVFWRAGTINCKMLKNLTGKCGDVVPDKIYPNFYYSGPNFYDSHIKTDYMPRCVYCLETHYSETYPVHDPCGRFGINPGILGVSNPHGNVYIR